MTINYRIQTFDHQDPPHQLKTINIRNAVVLPALKHIVNIDLEDYIVTEIRHRVAYKTDHFVSESGIQSECQQIDDIVVIACKKEADASYSIS